MVVRGKQVIVVLLLALGVGLFGFASLRAQATAGNTVAPAAVRPFVAPPALPSDGFQFAVIGDYGSNTINEERVADLVAGWQPAFVVTTGDNNYDNGAATTIDRNIGQYYSPFIGNYQGQYGDGTRLSSPAPVQVRNDLGYTAVAGGGQHAVSVNRNGGLAVWGFRGLEVWRFGGLEVWGFRGLAVWKVPGFGGLGA